MKKGHACRQVGFTLVELIIVIAIIGILSAILAGTLNPGALIGKGNDARRKKDLGRIKVAMEEYFNDKQCYPDNDLVISENIASNCGKKIFGLSGRPCDPVTRQPYIIVTQQPTDCPRFYKIFTKLDNPNDKDIPANWLSSIKRMGVGTTVFTENDVNYGVSSVNVAWDDRMSAEKCDRGYCNLKKVVNGVEMAGCQAAASGCMTNPSEGITCYDTNFDCTYECQVYCCGEGCDQ